MKIKLPAFSHENSANIFGYSKCFIISATLMKKETIKTWLKRIGAVGFLFFLIKGIAWLFIAAAVYFAAKK